MAPCRVALSPCGCRDPARCSSPGLSQRVSLGSFSGFCCWERTRVSVTSRDVVRSGCRAWAQTQGLPAGLRRLELPQERRETVGRTPAPRLSVLTSVGRLQTNGPEWTCFPAHVHRRVSHGLCTRVSCVKSLPCCPDSSLGCSRRPRPGPPLGVGNIFLSPRVSTFFRVSFDSFSPSCCSSPCQRPRDSLHPGSCPSALGGSSPGDTPAGVGTGGSEFGYQPPGPPAGHGGQ